MKYNKCVKQHLSKSATETDSIKLQSIFNKSIETLKSVEHYIDSQEYNFLEETIETRAIPTPKLLIKDHKKPNDQGEYPTRLVVPATNITVGFPKLGYMGIRKIFDKKKICYDKHTIVQASDLKEEIEKHTIKRSNSTNISLDIKSMYPSIQFSVVK